MAIENKYKAKDVELFAEVQKIKDGTSQNYNRLYELSEKYIYKIINDIVKNHHTTEDLMQESYIQIYNKLDTLQEAKAFYVWAGRIATNLTLRYIQKNSKEVLVTADEEGETNFIFDKAADDNEEFIPEAVLVDKEKQRLLAEIIDNLSTEQKFCVQYFYYEEMSVNEIAELMGCSTGTVKSRLNYARKSIKDAVIELDVKHGTRLYSLSALPLFWIIFREGLELLVLSGSAVGAAATVGAASAAEATGGAGMASAAGGASKAAEGFAKVFETVKTKTIEYTKALVNDVKSSVNPAKEVIKGEKEIITLAAFEGKKEALKATGQSLINIGKAAGKGFWAWETSSKVITIVIALIIVGNVGSNIIPDAPKKEKKPKKEVVEVQEEQVVLETEEFVTVENQKQENNQEENIEEYIEQGSEYVEEEQQFVSKQPEKEVRVGSLSINMKTRLEDDGTLQYRAFGSSENGAAIYQEAPVIYHYNFSGLIDGERIYKTQVDWVLDVETQKIVMEIEKGFRERHTIPLEMEVLGEGLASTIDSPDQEQEVRLYHKEDIIEDLGEDNYEIMIDGIKYRWEIYSISLYGNRTKMFRDERMVTLYEVIMHGDVYEIKEVDEQTGVTNEQTDVYLD